MHRALLVPHQNVAQPVLLEEFVIDRQHGAAGIAEYDVDALVQQGPDDDLRTGHLVVRRHRSSPQALFRLDEFQYVPQKPRSEEHTSELQSLMSISYAVFCLKKKNTTQL